MIAIVPLVRDLGSTTRINVSLDLGLLEAIDSEARQRKQTRSCVYCFSSSQRARGVRGHRMHKFRALVFMALSTFALPAFADPAYLDDRSTAGSLVRSFYNAVNLHQYARAYSYFGDNAAPEPYENFAQGYQDTQFVTVVTGAEQKRRHGRQHLLYDTGGDRRGLGWRRPQAVRRLLYNAPDRS